MQSLSTRSNNVLEASSRLGVVRVTDWGIKYDNNLRGNIYNPDDSDDKIIRITQQTNGYEIRVRLKINDKFYNGILERGE